MEMTPVTHLTILTYYKSSSEKCFKLFKLLESLELKFDSVLLGKEINFYKEKLPPEDNLEQFKKLLSDPQEFNNKINFNVYIEHESTIEVWKTVEVTENYSTTRVYIYKKCPDKCGYCESNNCDMCNTKSFGLVKNNETSLNNQLYFLSQIIFDMAYVVCIENKKKLFSNKFKKVGYFIGKKSFILIFILFQVFRLDVRIRKLIHSLIVDYPEKKWVTFCDEPPTTVLIKKGSNHFLKENKENELYSQFFSKIKA